MTPDELSVLVIVLLVILAALNLDALREDDYL